MIEVHEVQQLVQKHLPDCQVEVQGEGNKFLVVAVGSVFEGLSPVKRQQLVYGAMTAQLADGSIHAVTIRANTPAEFEKLKSATN